MKNCDTIAPAVLERTLPRSGPETPLCPPGAGLTGPPSDLAFACPVCASPLRVPLDRVEAVGTCPVCRSGVVAPQPAFGCRAMPYREWLRQQEIDWHDVPPPPPATAPTFPRRPRLAVPRVRRTRWAVWTGSVAAVGLAAWAGLAPRGSSVREPSLPAAPLATVVATLPVPPSSPPSSLPEAPVVPSATPSRRAPSPTPAPAPVPPPPSPFARVLLKQTPTPEPVIVRATRVHDFARSAPDADSTLCLKLADPLDPGLSARAYVGASEPTAHQINERLPWGNESLVRVRLRWQDPDPAAGIAGHWRVASLEAAPAP